MNAARKKNNDRLDIALYDLPVTWDWKIVSDIGADEKNAIVDGPFGSNLKVSDYIENGPVPVLTTKNLEGDYSKVRFISQKKFEEIKRSAVRPGDILMAKIGSCGKTGIYPPNMPTAIIPANLLKVSLNRHFNTKYVYYYFNSRFFQDALRSITKATAQPAFGVTNFRRLPIPAAPLDQQDRIVAEIEKQFSRLDEAVASFKRVKANLKRYKAAVLKAAVEGKLTEQWRKQNPDIEPASELLERILAERRAKWEEAELAKMKKKGKEPKDDKWKKKYKGPWPPLVEQLSMLPYGWEWSTFERLSDRVTVGHVGPMKNEYVNDGIPFLRSQNVRENRYEPLGLKFITESFHKKLAKSSLSPGDLVIVRSGSVGVTCVIPAELPAANCSDLVIVKQPRGVIPEYGSYYMNSIVNTRVAAGRVGVALVHFNTRSVAELPVPVPPLNEQQICVSKADEMFTIIEAVNNQIEKHLIKIEKLQTTILSRAFMGALLV